MYAVLRIYTCTVPCMPPYILTCTTASSCTGELPGEGLAFCTLSTLKRYASARDGNFTAARDNLLRTLQVCVPRVRVVVMCS